MLGLVGVVNQFPTVNSNHGTLNCGLSKMKVDIYDLLIALTEKKVCLGERKTMLTTLWFMWIQIMGEDYMQNNPIRNTNIIIYLIKSKN